VKDKHVPMGVRHVSVLTVSLKQNGFLHVNYISDNPTGLTVVVRIPSSSVVAKDSGD
jgi:hypothetical protein